RRCAPGRSAPAPLRAGIPGSRTLRSCLPARAAHAAQRDRYALLHRAGRGGGEPVRLERLGGGPQPAPPGTGAAVERGALLERATERLDDGAQLGLVELLPVAGARGARDVLVHEGAAEVVASGLERLAGTGDTGLDPRHLHVVDPTPVRYAAD